MKPQRVAFTCGIVMFFMCYLSGFNWTPYLYKKSKTNITNETIEGTTHQKRTHLKYILQWKKKDKEPYTLMKEGQDVFRERSCDVKNCYVTSNRTFLSNVSDYDAILFYCHELSRRGFIRLSKTRSERQKYVFVCVEASGYYPVFHERYNRFFNMTWTYKLDSDVLYGYIIIKDEEGKIIGPKEVMHWSKITEMTPINHKIREKLNSKKKAAAWFVSNCVARSGRNNVAKKIKEELSEYNMTLDVYGECGENQCPRNETCWKMLENDYYFYLSFENSISEDYVTEKLLNPLQHYTVPIVYGGANYTRFMPDGIYLNARTVTEKELVKQMVDIINNKEKYYDFFRWHNHYTYHNSSDAPKSDHFCNFCKKINNADFMNRATLSKNLVRWWNGWNVGD